MNDQIISNLENEQNYLAQSKKEWKKVTTLFFLASIIFIVINISILVISTLIEPNHRWIILLCGSIVLWLVSLVVYIRYYFIRKEYYEVSMLLARLRNLQPNSKLY